MKWAYLAVFCLLPLQWYYVATTPLGVGRLHQLAILGFAAALLRHRTSPAPCCPCVASSGSSCWPTSSCSPRGRRPSSTTASCRPGRSRSSCTSRVYLAIGGYLLRIAVYEDRGGVELMPMDRAGRQRDGARRPVVLDGEERRRTRPRCSARR